jgi:hypothetical protein
MTQSHIYRNRTCNLSSLYGVVTTSCRCSITRKLGNKLGIDGEGSCVPGPDEDAGVMGLGEGGAAAEDAEAGGVRGAAAGC